MQGVGGRGQRSEEYAVLPEGNRHLKELKRALVEAEVCFWLKVL